MYTELYIVVLGAASINISLHSLTATKSIDLVYKCVRVTLKARPNSQQLSAYESLKTKGKSPSYALTAAYKNVRLRE